MELDMVRLHIWDFNNDSSNQIVSHFHYFEGNAGIFFSIPELESL